MSQASRAQPTATGLWPRLVGAELLVVCGAGGVGKTTVSAALGLALAREGKRVLVLTVDPARRLAEALGHDLGPDPAHVQLDGEPGMSAAMLDAATSFARVVDRLPVREVERERLRGSRITRELTGGDAGMQELMAIVELQRFSESGEYDAIVLDTPPALHALELLDGPQRIVGLLSGRTVKAISRASGLAGRLGRLPGPGRALNKLWGADLLVEIATFLDAAAPFGAALAEGLTSAEALLRSDRAAFTLVAAPADAPLSSAGKLAAELAKRGHPVAGTIINRRRAPLDPTLDAESLGALSATLDDLSLTRSAVLARHIAEVQANETHLLMRAALPTPRIALAERPPHDSPAEVLGGLATALARP